MSAQAEKPKLTPRQRLVLSTLGAVSKSEGQIAKDALIRTTWPAETARKHLMGLRKVGLAIEIKARPPLWQATPAGRAAISPASTERKE